MMWLPLYALFSKFLCSTWLALYSLCAPHDTQGLIARHFPDTECAALIGKKTLMNPRLTPCIAIKTRSRSGDTMIVVILLILLWNEAGDFWSVCCACLFPDPACSCGMLGYGWYAEHQLHGSQLLCLSSDHSLNVFNKSHSFPLPVLSPQDFLILACYFLPLYAA